MNDRERFSSIMHYRPVDRCPIRDFGFWEETLLVWKQYGLPQSVPEQISTDDFFGMDGARLCGGIVDLWPFFEEEILEDKGDTEIVRDRDGVVLERGKIMGAIPRHLDHLLKDRQSWEEHYKPRMCPDHPERISSEGGWGGFDERVLARSKQGITDEVERLAPTVEEGGFIPFCDHLVPPDVPLGNYVHYVKEAKRVWGGGGDGLRPTSEPDWAGARFKEEDGYSWDLKRLGLSAESLSQPSHE
jgi:hypothetical protein